ncbi:MAG: cupin [Acidobacteria bacterium]|nr:MAG: cupin [Acidobacteriota bacterium]PIE90017.1 MAG: cupin [Acidobacteriota bacterium]
MPQQTVKNISTETPEPLAALITPRANQVLSMALSNSEHVHINLFSFADGEMVSEEEYAGSTIYYLLEGETIISRDGRKDRLKAGDVLAVPGHVLHAVGGLSAFSMLQITVNE